MADAPKPAAAPAGAAAAGAAPAPGGAPGEPSMEEILASIRRILSEDEGGQGAAAAPADPPEAAKGDDGVLQLTEEMLAGETAPAAAPPAPAPMPAAPAALSPAEAMPGPPPPPPSLPPSLPPAQPLPVSPPPAYASPLPPVPMPASMPGDGLLDAGAAAATAAAFGALARGGPMPAPPAQHWPVGHGAISVEEIVRQELRPLLAAWLNANLPRIVEEAVAREMERVRSRL
jgi:cell pole-organizing protein PopZ